MNIIYIGTIAMTKYMTKWLKERYDRVWLRKETKALYDEICKAMALPLVDCFDRIAYMITGQAPQPIAIGTIEEEEEKKPEEEVEEEEEGLLAYMKPKRPLPPP